MFKTMNFQDDTSSNPFDNCKDHYVLALDLSSMQDATKHCLYLEVVEDLLRWELYFGSHLVKVTEVIGLGERMSSASIDKFDVVGKKL